MKAWFSLGLLAAVQATILEFDPPILDLKDSLVRNTFRCRLKERKERPVQVYFEGNGIQFGNCSVTINPDRATEWHEVQILGVPVFEERRQVELPIKITAYDGNDRRDHEYRYRRTPLPGGVCTSTGDPHYKTFDDFSVTHMGNGIYHLFEHRDLQIQATQASCVTRGATCNHAIAIRFGGSIIALDIRQGRGQGETYTMRQITPNNDGIVYIPPSKKDAFHTVRLPCGSIIKLTAHFTKKDRWIDASLHIAGRYEGYGGICNQYRDNSKRLLCKGGKRVGRNEVAVFMNSWKVPDAENLLLGNYRTSTPEIRVPILNCKIPDRPQPERPPVPPPTLPPYTPPAGVASTTVIAPGTTQVIVSTQASAPADVATTQAPQNPAPSTSAPVNDAPNTTSAVNDAPNTTSAANNAPPATTSPAVTATNPPVNDAPGTTAIVDTTSAAAGVTTAVSAVPSQPAQETLPVPSNPGQTQSEQPPQVTQPPNQPPNNPPGQPQQPPNNPPGQPPQPSNNPQPSPTQIVEPPPPPPPQPSPSLPVEPPQEYKDQVNRHCRALFQIQGCSSLVNAEFFIQACIQDSMISGSLQFAEGSKMAYMAQCRQRAEYMSRDYEPQVVQKAEEIKREGGLGQFECLNKCSGQGTCGDNGCRCNQGFGGLDCSVDMSKMMSYKPERRVFSEGTPREDLPVIPNEAELPEQPETNGYGEGNAPSITTSSAYHHGVGIAFAALLLSL
jgi:hypothetical protein